MAIPEFELLQNFKISNETERNSASNSKILSPFRLSATEAEAKG